MGKTNHGPCLVCGRPILYFGCRFCSPGCNFDFLRSLAAPGTARMEGDWSDLGPVTDLTEPLVPPAAVLGPEVPEPECARCGGPIEPARLCYAIPTCYGCLPPPEALEAAEPEPEPATSGFMGISSPPDEVPSGRRRAS